MEIRPALHAHLEWPAQHNPLRAATVVDAFWSKGYGATSTRDLAQQTGLSVTSLYNAFGDKQSLFRHALRHYLDETLKARIQRLEESLPPADAITAFGPRDGRPAG